MSKDPVKSRIGGLAIGLAVDCDAEPGAVAQILDANLAGASTLPFVGVLTYDGQWVGGYSGYKDAAGLTAFINEVEKSPKLEAKASVREQLKKLAIAAHAAAKKKKWGDVIAAASKGADLFGRCPERAELSAAEKMARDWLQARFDAVVADAQSGAKMVAAKKQLLTVQRAFKGQPEEAIAKRGVEAIKKLNRLRSIEARGNVKAGLREGIAKEFDGTPWVAMFAKADKAAKAGKPKR